MVRHSEPILLLGLDVWELSQGRFESLSARPAGSSIQGFQEGEAGDSFDVVREVAAVFGDEGVGAAVKGGGEMDGFRGTKAVSGAQIGGDLHPRR